MFEVKVTVELPGVPEAINNLADAVRGKSSIQPVSTTPALVTTAPAALTEAVTSEAPAPIPFPAATTAPAAAPEPVQDAAPAAPAAPAPAPAPKKYSFKQISTAGARLCADPGKMDRLVALLNDKYGVPAITMIDESRYGELADDLIALGAVIEED